MEYIEGPDLEELLKPPHDPVFTIKEVIKVAEQLSNALAHCHSFDVKHGDIKSNNVKFNIRTGNYVLLDFGLAIMSDEQRRTSLRHAGAVEFMAPEQNEGLMFFQTDVYSFGVILFELLAGRVPFPLQDKGETARKAVRLAHMETLPPDVISLRKEAMPLTWQAERRAREMNIPEWLVTTIYKCLRKKPENRFANGVQLYEYVTFNSIKASENKQPEHINVKNDIQKLLREKEQLQQQILEYKQQISTKDKELHELKAVVDNKDHKTNYFNDYPKIYSSQKKGVSKTAFALLVLLTIGLAAFSAYNFLKNDQPEAITRTTTNSSDTTATTNKSPVKRVRQKKESAVVKKERQTAPSDSLNDSIGNSPQPMASAQNAEDSATKDTEQLKEEGGAEVPLKTSQQYVVTSKAYFYTTPDESTRRNAFVVPSNNAILKALDEQNNFIYVVFNNQHGQSSKGWLRKKDLQPLYE
jgi:serine/threonine-protein kinase